MTTLPNKTETTAPATTSIFYVCLDPTGTPLDRKVTGANLTKALDLTNVAASSGAITIASGANGNIAITPNGTGTASVGADPPSGAGFDVYLGNHVQVKGDLDIAPNGAGGNDLTWTEDETPDNHRALMRYLVSTNDFIIQTVRADGSTLQTVVAIDGEVDSPTVTYSFGIDLQNADFNMDFDYGVEASSSFNSLHFGLSGTDGNALRATGRCGLVCDSNNTSTNEEDGIYFARNGEKLTGSAVEFAKFLQGGGLRLLERSSDPPDAQVPEGTFVFWMSDGTGSGDDGDIMVKIQAGSTIKTGTLIDFSAI